MPSLLAGMPWRRMVKRSSLRPSSSLPDDGPLSSSMSRFVMAAWRARELAAERGVQVATVWGWARAVSASRSTGHDAWRACQPHHRPRSATHLRLPPAPTQMVRASLIAGLVCAGRGTPRRTVSRTTVGPVACSARNADTRCIGRRIPHRAAWGRLRPTSIVFLTPASAPQVSPSTSTPRCRARLSPAVGPHHAAVAAQQATARLGAAAAPRQTSAGVRMPTLVICISQRECRKRHRARQARNSAPRAVIGRLPLPGAAAVSPWALQHKPCPSIRQRGPP